MNKRRSYFPLTTPQQRKLLFETWQTTGNVTESCRRAQVGRTTFYYWKPRFDRQGFAGLEVFGSKVAHRLNRKASVVEERVLELRNQHPNWGKTRIADEITNRQQGAMKISPNTVRRILSEAGLWSSSRTLQSANQ